MKNWKTRMLIICAMLICGMIIVGGRNTVFAAEIVSSGECGANGDNLTWTLDSDGLLLIEGDGRMADRVKWGNNKPNIKVIEFLGNVTSIGEYAFSDCKYLENVTIPGSITSMGEEAFGECSKLENVTILDGATCIGQRAFLNCGNLEKVTIPNSVMDIGEMAFEYCEKITSAGPIGSGCNVEFGWTTQIPYMAFSYCMSLKRIIIPGGITSIGEYAFDECIVLESITIPESVTSIGDCAFAGCRSLTGIIIPNSVTSIGKNAFNGCSSLESITIPESVTSIGDYAFAGCRSLTGIIIPNSVTSIGSGAFSDCWKLEEIILSKNMTSIGNYTFSGCSNLKRITIPKSVTSMGSEVFLNCNSLTDVYALNGDAKISWYEIIHSLPNTCTIHGPRWSNVHKAVVDEGGPCKFEIYCEHINTVEEATIKATCNSLGYSTGIYCKDCEQYLSGHEQIDKLSHEDQDGDHICDSCKRSLVIDSSGTCGKDINWVLYKDGYLEISGSGEMNDYSAGKTPWEKWKDSITTVEINGQITDVCSYAFSGCTNLKTVIFPEGLDVIWNEAFSGCTSLNSISLPNSLRSLVWRTFSGCTNLTSITISNSTDIGGGVFERCTKLQSISIPRWTDFIESSTFENCSSLTEVVIPEWIEDVASWAFADCSKLSSVIFLGDMDGEFGIDQTAFNNCSSNLVIYGYEGTDAEYYAECNAIAFKPLPAITTQPKNTAVGAGKKVTLSVKAYGLAEPQYQWYFRPGADDDWQPVGEESGTTAAYSFTAAAEQDGYQYRCKVFNEERTLTSSTATLTVVTAKPTIKTQPKDTTVASSKKATFTVTATGKALCYQWYYRTSSTASWKKLTVASAKTASYSVTAESGKHGYQYYCAVTNPMGTVKSNTVTLTVVTAKPTIKTQPTAQTVKSGTKVTFKVVASGRALSYQWWYRISSSGTWKKISSGTKASYSVTTEKKHNGYEYKCVVSNAKGDVTSKVVKLTVVAAKPTIKTQPKAVSVKAGAKATFKVVASGTALSYQWYYRTKSTAKWTKITTAAGKKATYTFTTAKKQNGYEYKCEVTNLKGTVTSKVVKLTVK